MENPQNKLAQGTLFENSVAFLREQKGEAAINELEKTTGPLIFEHYRMYPLQELDTLQAAVLEAVYGDASDEHYRELGTFTFQTFIKTVAGATLTNVAGSPQELLEKIQDLWGAVVNFGTRRLISIDSEKRIALVEIIDDPRRPTYLQGAIEGGLLVVGVNASTRIVQANKEHASYQIEVSW